MSFTSSRSAASAVLLAYAAAACGSATDPPTIPLMATATVAVRVITLDDVPLTKGLVVARRSNGAIDSVPLSSIGEGTVRARIGDTVELRVDYPEPRRYHPSIGQFIVQRDTMVDVIAIPTKWSVRLGRYRGDERTIDIVNAFGSDANDTHFLNRFTPSRKILIGWPEDALPIGVGYDSSGATQRWTPADSALLWNALDDFNAAMGRLVFQPTGSVALSTRRVIGIRVNFDLRTYTPPEGGLGSNFDSCTPPARFCDDVHGVASFASGQFYQNKQSIYYNDPSRLFQHELMHALGFGHGCYWPSIMMHTGGSCTTAAVPPDISADDVAYMELIFRLASVLQRHQQAWHLDEALTGALATR